MARKSRQARTESTQAPEGLVAEQVANAETTVEGADDAEGSEEAAAAEAPGAESTDTPSEAAPAAEGGGQIDPKLVNYDELKVRLIEAGVKPTARWSNERLIAEAQSHDIELPMLETPPKRGNVIGEKYRGRYGKDQSNGDQIATAMKAYVTTKDGCDPVLLREVADANGVDLDRWKHLNIGMQRMNLGNVLRAAFNKGQKVVIGTAEFQEDAEGEEAAQKIS